jgi:hypothetical protein
MKRQRGHFTVEPGTKRAGSGSATRNPDKSAAPARLSNS